MAIVVFVNGKKMRLPAGKAHEVWKVLNNEIEGDEKQQEFCMKVDKIYLNWHNAPDSYIKAHFEILAPMIIGQWMVAPVALGDGRKSSIGEPARPEPSARDNWAFSEKWGLIAYGRPTPLAKSYFSQVCKGYVNDSRVHRGIRQGMTEALPVNDR